MKQSLILLIIFHAAFFLELRGDSSALNVFEVAALQKKAQANDLDAQRSLVTHFQRLGDFEKAEMWLLRTVELGDEKGLGALGLLCYSFERYEEALSWFRKAADLDDPDAEFMFGFMNLMGEGTAVDESTAYQYFQRAAKKEHVRAQGFLGLCYYDAKGVEQNYKEAVRWLRLSAKQGYALAQSLLGECHFQGLGTPKDLMQAEYWFSLAAQQGDVRATKRLGFGFFYGDGFSQNKAKAAPWIQLLAENGDRAAQKIISPKTKDPWNSADESIFAADTRAMSSRIAGASQDDANILAKRAALQTLETLIAEKKEELSRWSEQESELTHTIATLRKNKATLLTETERFTEERNTINAEIASLTKKAEELAQTHAKTQKERKRQQQEAAARSVAQIQTQRSALKSFEALVAAKKEEASRWCEEERELTNAIATLRQNKITLLTETERFTQEKMAINAEIASLRKEAEELACMNFKRKKTLMPRSSSITSLNYLEKAARSGNASALTRVLNEKLFNTHDVALVDPKLALAIYQDAVRVNPSLRFDPKREKTLIYCAELRSFNVQGFLDAYGLGRVNNQTHPLRMWAFAEEASRGGRFGVPSAEVVFQLIVHGGHAGQDFDSVVKWAHENWIQDRVVEFKISEHVNDASGVKRRAK